MVRPLIQWLSASAESMTEPNFKTMVLVFVCEWVNKTHVWCDYKRKLKSLVEELWVAWNHVGSRTVTEYWEGAVRVKRKNILGSGDKTVFGKRSLFWLKFEYVIFVVHETKQSWNPSSERYRLLNGLEYRTSLCGDDNTKILTFDTTSRHNHVIARCNRPFFARFILLFIYMCLHVLICD